MTASRRRDTVGHWLLLLLLVLTSAVRLTWSDTYDEDVSLDTVAQPTVNVSCAAECRCLVIGHWFRMNCLATEFVVLPDSPSSTHRITILDLSQNSLSHLADHTFARYHHLQELNLASNRVANLSSHVFSGISKLRILNLRGNNLTSVPVHTFHDLRFLHELHLGQNQIGTISARDFRDLTVLRTLTLEDNRLRVVPVDALADLSSLEVLSLMNNNVSRIPDRAFRNLTGLRALNLASNRIDGVGPEAFVGLASLEVLELQHNRLEAIPSAICDLILLQKISVAFNRIEYIPDSIFERNSRLVHADLLGNPVARVERRVFANLTRLKILIIPEAKELSEFPDLNGTISMEFLRIDRARIHSVPPDLCLVSGTLKTLDLKSNLLTEIPLLDDCTELRQLQLSGNRIRSLEGKLFRNQGLLHDLLLSGNAIVSITSDDFVGLHKLEILNLAANRIADIHPNAFLPLKQLVYINVAENQFPLLPSRGLEHVRQLLAHSNPHLRDFPPPSSLPHVHTLRLSFAYHCCQFMSLSHDTGRSRVPFDLQETVLWLPKDKVDLSLWAGNASDIWPAYQNLTHKFGDLAEDLWGSLSPDYVYPSNFPQVVEDYFEEIKPNDNGRIGQAVSCSPLPGPFMPCEDLFDWWTLRCGVWIVFLLAMLGNGTVVFVLVFSRTKMDVPRFLVCNLAMADFFMGIYLGFLALVDASTLGQFKRHALQWQFSVTCQLAGFLGVLSSELSVFTLAVITLERNYAITHAMHLNKRLSLKHASYVMSVGWAFGLVMAALPLAGVSDYRTFAVCLPFNIESAWSLAYVVFLMSINGVAFLILMGCYLKMYCAIRGSQAWNSNDSRIAKRMALLVFTDFICWAPIAFFALTAAFGLRLVSLEEAKVFTIFVLPLNSCANPFLYAILTKQFKKDCVLICKAIEESRVTRGIGRCRHSSNFSNRQTPGNTNSAVNSNNGQVPACSCSRSSTDGVGVRTAGHPPLPHHHHHHHHQHHHQMAVSDEDRRRHARESSSSAAPSVSTVPSRRSTDWWRSILWCGDNDDDDDSDRRRRRRRDGMSSSSAGNEYAHAIAEIQKNQQNKKHARNMSLSSDGNFSSSHSDSWRQKSSSGAGSGVVVGGGTGGGTGANNHHGVSMRLLTDKSRRNSWTITRKPSQDSSLSSSRNDSSATTPSTSTWRVSRSSVSSDMSSGHAQQQQQQQPPGPAARPPAALSQVVRSSNSTVPTSIGHTVDVVTPGPTVRFNLPSKSVNAPSSEVVVVVVQPTSARPRAKLKRQSAIADDEDEDDANVSPPPPSSPHRPPCRHPPTRDDRFSCAYTQLPTSSTDRSESSETGVGGSGTSVGPSDAATDRLRLIRCRHTPAVGRNPVDTVIVTRDLFLPRKLSTISSNSCSLNQDAWSVQAMGGSSDQHHRTARDTMTSSMTITPSATILETGERNSPLLERPMSMGDVHRATTAARTVDGDSKNGNTRRTMSDDTNFPSKRDADQVS